jgi:transketolase
MKSLLKSDIKILINKAYNSRIKVLKMMRNGSVHLGGALSCLDILTVLYNKILKHEPENPNWEKRDRFILSAGHKGVSLYVTLQEQGYFDEDILWTYYRIKSKVPEHPDDKSLPGIEFPTGSLGHGLSAGIGMALAAKLDKKDYKVFVLLGDGECDEGTVWEAAMASSHHRLDNLIAIIDRNGLQVNGKTEDIMNTSIIENKFKEFGWITKTIDGHNYNEIYGSLIKVPFKIGAPSCIVANTIKSKGVTFAENDFATHHCHWNGEQIDRAIDILEKNKLKELSDIE